MTDSTPHSSRRNPHLLRTAIVSLLAIIGVVGFVLAFALPGPENKPGRPAPVEAVSPESGDLDLRQNTIFADLAPGYTGYLLIDGVEVPDDDLQRIDGINHVVLRPTEDSSYRQLQPGRHCATIVYRQIGTPRNQSETYQWCFSLH